MRIIILLFLLLLSSNSFASSSWLERESGIALQKILQNSAAPGASPGSVIASPSQTSPNYYYHWVRDAALTMDTLVSAWNTSSDVNQKEVLRQRILNYLDFSRKNQMANTLTGLGEPKFYVDGQPYSYPWGRPQNDGPALRAIAAIHFATILLTQGQVSYVKKNLYDGTLPTNSLIKLDLEYVSHHWQDPSYDLWEETLGDHFYTRMVQRKALILGEKLARTLGDFGAADFYALQAKAITNSLSAFWDPNKNYIVSTLNRKAGIDYKSTNLDSAILLGALHGGMGDGIFDLTDSRVQASLQALIQNFSSLYPINQTNEPGTALGRYPEDRYNGSRNNGQGNPWVLITLAAAESYYKLALFTRNKTYAKVADDFVARVALHANPDGSLSEQIDRSTGYMVSAVDLTWNYAAILTTENAKSATVP